MKLDELKEIIKEEIISVIKEVAPPNFSRKLEKKILDQYPGEPQKAYATMWMIYNKKKKKKE